MNNTPDPIVEIIDHLILQACDYEAGKDVDLDAEANKALLALREVVEQEKLKAENIAGLKERRNEVYQIWTWAIKAHNKGIVKREHHGYIYMLYRRFNDLTDMLQEATGNMNYVHYDLDQNTLEPVEMKQLTAQLTKDKEQL